MLLDPDGQRARHDPVVRRRRAATHLTEDLGDRNALARQVVNQFQQVTRLLVLVVVHARDEHLLLLGRRELLLERERSAHLLVGPLEDLAEPGGERNSEDADLDVTAIAQYYPIMNCLGLPERAARLRRPSWLKSLPDAIHS